MLQLTHYQGIVMAKKNFDAFINAAGKKPKPTPEEVEAMAKQLHQAPAAIQPEPAVPPAATAQGPAKLPNKAKAKPKIADAPKKESRNAEPLVAPKEKVRITIDLAKDLYKRMKLAVVENETEISAYVRLLIEKDLSKK